MHNPEIQSTGSQESCLLMRKNGYNIVSVHPEKDKITRLSTVTPIMSGGRVKFDMQKHWYQSIEEQLLMFPNGKNDDIVDSISQFLNHVRNKNFDNKLKNDNIITNPVSITRW